MLRNSTPASLPHPSVKSEHCSWHCSNGKSSTARVAATSSCAHAFAVVRTRVRVAARILRGGKKRGVRGAGGGEGGAGWTRAPRRPGTHLGGLARRRGTHRCCRLRLSRRRGRLRRVAGNTFCAFHVTNATGGGVLARRARVDALRGTGISSGGSFGCLLARARDGMVMGANACILRARTQRGS